MGNRANSLFYSVLFNKFYHRTNMIALTLATLYLKDNRVLRIPKFWVVRVPLIQISNQNRKMEVLSEFHHRTNQTALLLSNLGSKNKTTYSEL
jgi:hypothetical protein